MDHNVDKYLPTEAEIEEEANRPASWPKSIFRIANAEKPQFYRMGMMFLIIAFVYSILRDTKDVVVLEKQEATSINIIKSMLVTPTSIGFVFIIQTMLNTYTVSQILKIMTLVFGIYFMLYSTVLMSLSNYIEPTPVWCDSFFSDGKMAIRGAEFFLAIFKTINFWTGSLLYISAELWGNIILCLLFWNYSNEVCTAQQSSRFIPIFILFSNVGLFVSGACLLGFFYLFDNFSYSVAKYVVNGIVFLMGVCCVAISLIHVNLEKKILSKPIFIRDTSIKKKGKAKQKVGFVEGLVYMLKSKLLLNICLIVLAYNICTNLIDSVFKSTMKQAAIAQNKNVGASVMKTQAINQIIISICVIIFLCTPFSRLVQIMGWAAMGFITPIFAIGGGIGIFGLAIYNTGADGINMWTFINNMLKSKSNLISIEQNVGRIIASFMKVFKYAAFDVCKEAISCRINPIDRPRFKGIFDGLCGKLGKSTGSILAMVFTYFSNSTDIRKACQLCLFVTIVVGATWIYSVRYLGQKYQTSISNNAEIDLDMIGESKINDEL